MTQYITQIEDLIKMNPIGRQRLNEDTIDEVSKSLAPDACEIETQEFYKEVVMRKLQEATDEIIAAQNAKIARLESIINEFGSLEAFKEHIEQVKMQHADDLANAMLKEQERREAAEKEQKKKNAKNSEENKQKVKRWLGNYEKKTIEIIQEEIDILAEMQEEETLAGLALIQDDAMEEHNNYLDAKEQLNDLILTINTEVRDLKRTLRQRANEKSGKLDMTELTSSKGDVLGKERLAVGSLDSDDPEVGGEDIGKSSGDLERDSKGFSDSSGDRKSRRSAKRKEKAVASHRRSAYALSRAGGHSPASLSSSSSTEPEVAGATQGRNTRTSRRTGDNSGGRGTAGGVSHERSSRSRARTPMSVDSEAERRAKIEAEKKALAKMRKKRHKQKRK